MDEDKLDKLDKLREEFNSSLNDKQEYQLDELIHDFAKRIAQQFKKIDESKILDKLKADILNKLESFNISVKPIIDEDGCYDSISSTFNLHDGFTNEASFISYLKKKNKKIDKSKIHIASTGFDAIKFIYTAELFFLDGKIDEGLEAYEKAKESSKSFYLKINRIKNNQKAGTLSKNKNKISDDTKAEIETLLKNNPKTKTEYAQAIIETIRKLNMDGIKVSKSYITKNFRQKHFLQSSVFHPLKISNLKKIRLASKKNSFFLLFFHNNLLPTYNQHLSRFIKHRYCMFNESHILLSSTNLQNSSNKASNIQ